MVDKKEIKLSEEQEKIAEEKRIKQELLNLQRAKDMFANLQAKFITEFGFKILPVKKTIYVDGRVETEICTLEYYMAPQDEIERAKRMLAKKGNKLTEETK